MDSNIKQHEIKALEVADKKQITLDITLPVSKVKTPVVIFCHGFKGFKDWGHFNWVAGEFAKQGLAFLKFNFSYNGTTKEQLTELTDMESFGKNNYMIELADLGAVIDFIEKNADNYNVDKKEIYLVGHSRGGGIAFLKANDDIRIKKLALWASVSSFESFFRPETIEQWNREGVVHAVNKRTGQQLPIMKQFYDNYLENADRLDIRKAAKIISTPLLIIHGDKDESVAISHSEALYELVQHSIFIKVENGDHTFGAKHPFNEATDVTEMLEELVENTVEFFVD